MDSLSAAGALPDSVDEQKNEEQGLRSASAHELLHDDDQPFESIELTDILQPRSYSPSLRDINIHKPKHGGLMAGARQFAGKFKTAVVGLVTGNSLAQSRVLSRQIWTPPLLFPLVQIFRNSCCLLYTSDAADE